MVKARFLVVAAAVLASMLVSAARAQVMDEKSKQVMEEATAAIQNLKNIHFKAKRSGTGILKDILDMEVEVKMTRSGAAKTRTPMLLKGYAVEPGAGKKEFWVASTGAMVQWVDEKMKTIYERPIARKTEAQNQLSIAQQIVLDEFSAAEPYDVDMKAEDLSYKGTETIRGEPCDVVIASYQGGLRKTTWAFSTRDRLPRRVERVTGTGKDEIAMIFELWDVQANTPMNPEDLMIPAMPGYVVDKVQNTEDQGDARPSVGPGTGTPAADFELTSAKGEKTSLTSLRGSVVVLNFWGTKFIASARTNPVFEELHKKFNDEGKDVKVFGLACRESDPQKAVKHFEEKGYTYDLLLDADEVAKAYQVKGFPSACVIDGKGNIVAFIQGVMQEDAMREALTNAINTAIANGK